MDPPPVQYVKTFDGYDIAYSESGQGPPLLLLPQGLFDIRFAWRAFGPWLPELASRFRLVQFDSRGRGLSSRGLSADHTNRDYEQDVAAVVERLDLRDLTIFGNGGFCHVAIRYAAANPDRIKSLILANCSISMGVWPQSLFRGVPAENWDLFIQSLVPPTLPEDEFQLWCKAMGETSDPEDWQIEQRSVFHSDVTDALPGLHMPTLVLHSRKFPFIGAPEVRRLAAAIEDARFESIEGRLLLPGDTQPLTVIDAFLREVGSRPASRLESAPALPPAGLSPRQIEVLRHIAKGGTNRQIASALVLSERTVERHVADIYAKIGTANRAQAAVYAQQHGLV